MLKLMELENHFTNYTMQALFNIQKNEMKKRNGGIFIFGTLIENDF